MSRFAALSVLALAAGSAGGQPPAVDLAGDPLPPGALVRLGTTRFRAQGYGSASAVLFPDGTRAAWMDVHGTILVWDVDTGGEFARVQGSELSAEMARNAVSPAGDRLAILARERSGKGLTLRLLDTRDLKPVWTTQWAGADQARPLRVTFTPDGKRLIAAGEDVRVFDVNTGDELRRQAFTGGTNGFELSPDGKTVAAGRADLWLWDWESENPPRKVERVEAARVEIYLFSPDGKQVCIGRRNSSVVQCFDVTTGQKAGTTDLGGRPRWVVPGPDGKTVAVAYNPAEGEAGQAAAIVLRDWATGKERGRLATGTTHPARHVAYNLAAVQWSRNGTRLLSRNGHRLWVWEVATGKQLGPTLVVAQPARVDLAGDPLPPGAIARIGTVRFLPRPQLEQVFFTPDGNTIFGRGGDNVIDFWDAATGKPAGELRDPDLRDFRIDLSPDGKHLAVFGQDIRGKPMPDTMLRVYDVATRKPVWTQVIDDVYCYYFAVRYTPDGRHLVTGTNADLRVWDAKTGVLVHKQKGSIGYSGMALSADGTLAAGGEQALWVWDWAADGPPRNLNLQSRRRFYHYMAFAQDGKTVHVHEAGRDTADGYDVASGNFVGTSDPSAAAWRSVSPDGRTVAAAHYDKDKRLGFVVLRETGTGKEVGRLASGSLTVRDSRWSPDGTRLVGAGTYRVWVWDVKSGKAFGPDVPRHEGRVLNLAFTSDGRLIAAADDGTVRAWDPNTGKELAHVLPPGNVYWRFAVSGDGSLLAAMPPMLPNEVRVWDAKSAAEVYKLAWSTSRTGGVFCIQFTSDDQTLLAFGSDYHLRAWDLVTGKLKVERKFRPDVLGPEDEDNDGPGRRGGAIMLPQSVDVGTDGDTLVMGVGKDATVYSLHTGKERFKVEADAQRVEAVVLSADAKRLLTAGPGPVQPKGAAGARQDFQVTVWDVTEAKQLCRFRAPGSAFFPVLRFTPDGRQVVTGSQDDRLRFWDATIGAAAGEIPLPRSPLALAFTQDGKRVAVAFADPTILVYDVAAARK